MQIDPIRLQRAASAGLEKATGVPETPETVAPAEATAAQPTAPAAANQIVLSQRAAEVQAAYEALAAVPDVRPELVAQLKAQIEAGTYKIDPEAIAKKLIP